MTDQPERYIDEFGNKIWYLLSKDKNYYHRLDGPAIEYIDGAKEWWVNSKRHRLDGPAIEWSNGSKEWWVDDRLHRLNGPAIDWVSGIKEWWIYGIEFLSIREVKTWLKENDVDLKTLEGQMAFKLRWL